MWYRRLTGAAGAAATHKSKMKWIFRSPLSVPVPQPSSLYRWDECRRGCAVRPSPVHAGCIQGSPHAHDGALAGVPLGIRRQQRAGGASDVHCSPRPARAQTARARAAWTQGDRSVDPKRQWPEPTGGRPTCLALVPQRVAGAALRDNAPPKGQLVRGTSLLSIRCKRADFAW